MSTDTATLLHPGWQHKKTLGASTPSGTVYVTPEGNVAVFQGLETLASGQPARFDNSEVYNFTKGSMSFAEGDNVYWDGTNVQQTGMIRIGRCAKAAASGDATVAVRLLKQADASRFAAIAASAAVTNTTTETAFDKTVTVPANYFRAGDILRVRLAVIATLTNSTDTLNVKLKLGSTVLVATGALDVANNDLAYIDFDLVIRTNGATGTMVGAGTSFIGTPGTASVKPVLLASTSIDTTADQALTVSATWGAANAGDSCRLDVLNVQLIRG